MKTWGFRNAETQEISGARFSGPESALAANTPEGFIAFEVDGQTPVRAIDPELRRSRTIARIDELERRQHRRVREVLNDPQLQAIEAQIAELRAQLT